MKRYLLALCVLVCAGCTPSVTKLNVKDIGSSDALSVVDARPASEKENKIFSLLITSKDYGIVRIGDGRLSPSAVRLLQHETFQKFAASGRQPTVTVRHLVIYQNMRSQLRSGAVGAGVGGALGGLVGNALGTHDASAHTTVIDELSFGGEEYLRGNYSAAENPDKASVWVIYIATEIDGKKVFTRTVASMKPHDDGNPFAEAVQLAIENHLARYDVDTNHATASAAMAAAAEVGPSSTASVTALATPLATPQSPVPAAASSTDASLAAMAQSVANQLKCGTVRPHGDAIFLASCGAYDVAIDCDGGRCHPTHTVKSESN